MRRCVIVLMILFALAVDSPWPAEAGAFATEFTQLLNHAQLVLQYIQQGQQLANELNMYADMLRNSRTLGSQTFGSVGADITALARIVQGGQALAYSLGNLDQIFRTTYPGYRTAPNTYYLQYRDWSQTSLDTTLGALRAAGLQGQQLQSEQAIESSLQAMAQRSDGRMEALQVLADINDQQVQQLMNLREIMLADMSSKQAYQATVIQQEAASQAATEWFFTTGKVTNDGRTYLPGLR
jgi:P-type conjugative transfer protein TrbJ